MQDSTLPKLIDQWRSITSNRFLLNMVKGHHFQFRCLPLLLPNFRWFNIKADLPYPIIHKRVDELWAKGANEPFNGGTGFYSNVLVVPKNTGGL